MKNQDDKMFNLVNMDLKYWLRNFKNQQSNLELLNYYLNNTLYLMGWYIT